MFGSAKEGRTIREQIERKSMTGSNLNGLIVELFSPHKTEEQTVEGEFYR